MPPPTHDPLPTTVPVTVLLWCCGEGEERERGGRGRWPGAGVVLGVSSAGSYFVTLLTVVEPVAFVWYFWLLVVVVVDVVDVDDDVVLRYIVCCVVVVVRAPRLCASHADRRLRSDGGPPGPTTSRPLIRPLT